MFNFNDDEKEFIKRFCNDIKLFVGHSKLVKECKEMKQLLEKVQKNEKFVLDDF